MAADRTKTSRRTAGWRRQAADWWTEKAQREWRLDETHGFELEDLQQTLVAELGPTSRSERDLVEGLGAALWRNSHAEDQD